MTKQNLLNVLENYSFYQDNPEFNLIVKLIKGTSEDDPDFKDALEYGFAEQIVNLFLDCYCGSNFIRWLNEHDFDLFDSFRFADIAFKEDYESEEEWEDAKNNALMINDDKTAVCLSW